MFFEKLKQKKNKKKQSTSVIRLDAGLSLLMCLDKLKMMNLTAENEWIKGCAQHLLNMEVCGP